MSANNSFFDVASKVPPHDGPSKVAENYGHGDLGPFPYSPYEAAQLSERTRLALEALVNKISNKDIAARRWAVEQTWEAELMDRGYQRLIPRRGGGWIFPPYATTYSRGSGNNARTSSAGEVNVYAAYGDIVASALTRDRPEIRFEPADPRSDADITAAEAANKFKKLFCRSNDLMQLQQQAAWYLWTGGYVVFVTDFIIDAQKYGRDPLPGEAPKAVVPETEQNTPVLLYFMRHGASEANVEGRMRGQIASELAPVGEDEAIRGAAYLKTKGVKALFASPVERASETARIAANTLGLAPDFDPRLAALDIGRASGAPMGAISVGDAFREHPDEPIGGSGETPAGFTARVRSFLADAVKNAALVAPAAVITHDSVIRQVYEAIGGDLEPEVSPVPPGGIAALSLGPGGGFVIRQVYPAIATSQTEESRRGRPRGQEVVTAYGKLQAKLPAEAQCLDDCAFVQVAQEFDYTQLRGMFPEKANQIMPGGSGGGENELDRIARINAALALEASYVTGDSMVRSATYQRTWIRPAMFLDVDDEDCRAELLEAFPDGCLAIYAGQCFILARNERLDDHVSLVQAFPGAGVNRRALGSSLIPVQKQLNNWVALLNDYFLRTIPQRYIENRAFNVEAIRNQTATPGGYIPFDRSQVPPNMSAKDLIFVEDTPQPQPAMPQFIELFFNQFPQTLSGALPTLFGSYANTDTVGAVSIQRDQALARLGTPWHSLREATARYFLQAVRLAAQCRQGDVIGTLGSGQRIQIEIADLRGNVLAFPEESPNFPESWVQKEQKMQMLVQNAANPFVAGLLGTPNNLRLARNAIGLSDFEVPAAESYDKQLGEFELLLSSEPLPNPALEEARQKAELLAAEAARTGLPALVQEAEAAMHALQGIPPLISSVPVDQDVDDNSAEAQACLDFLRSAEGRRLKYGSPASQAAYANVRLHMLEHQKGMEEQAKNKVSVKVKPPSVSIPFKDMPPSAGAQLLDRMGLDTAPGDVAAEREAQAVEKRASKGVPSPPA